MKNINAANERVKRSYLSYLKEAKRQSEPSLDAVAKALHRFETYNRLKDFRAFKHEQASAFKRHLADQVNVRTGERLAKATMYSTLAALKAFFHWLAGQPGFKSRLTYDDAEYFNLSDKDTAIAKAHRDKAVPTLEQIKHVIATMPATTDIERRDRALVAFTILTGARDGAIASMRIKHIDIVAGVVEQDAREVKTKFSKTFPTWFFPVGDDIRQIVVEWVEFLIKEKAWGRDDPLFPATALAQDAEHKFIASGVKRGHWSSAGPIRDTFKRAFAAAGLPYFSPHTFRNTLALLGMKLCKTPEAQKAWSQNLGHNSVMTTLMSYGTVARDRQAEIMRAFRPNEERDDEEDLLQRLIDLHRANAARR